MSGPNNLEPPEASGTSPSGTEPLDEAMPSSETGANTFIQKTLSESGNEAAQTSAAKSSAVVVGSMLGPYQIVRKLGQGGMGAVYEARHTKLKKTVAVKVLPPETMKSPTLVARFEREMEAVGKLDDPHIVRAMDAGEFQGTHFLVMEFVDGSDLSQRVKEHGPLSVAEACDAIRQAALGLQHAHEYGLVHRDVKPSNLLMSVVSGPLSVGNTPTHNGPRTTGNRPTIKILDLGLARLGNHDESQAGLTSSGQVLGTPDYMAPEQWDDTHTADARSDLYSLGCTLFFLLTGKAPYSADKPRSVMHLMKAHIDGEIPDLTARCPDVPSELNAIYRRLLAKKPEDRIQTAAEVATALEPFVRSPVAPRQESRTSADAVRATDPQSTTDASRAPGLPVAERQGYVDTPTTSILASQTSSSGPSTTRKRVIFVAALLACVVLAVVFSRVGRGTRPTDSTSSPRPSALAPQPTTSWHGWPADAPQPAIAPFNAEQAEQHQAAWAEFLGVPAEYENSLGMKFRLIPPGEFLMGSTPEEIAAALKDSGGDKHWQECIQSEAPQHKVILTLPIYLGVNEVTQAEYEKVMGVNPSHFAPMGAGKEAVAGLKTADHPVEMVSWNDAAEFCAKLSQREKLKPFYIRAGETITPLDGTGYRLPSEAEWECACRAGTATKYWIGDQDEDLTRAGWSGGNSGQRTHAVGELKANPFGLADIHGNVWEWVQDGWDATWYGQFQERPAINPYSPFSADSLSVIRGSHWFLTAAACRSSGRDAYVPTFRFNSIGFRVSLPVDAVRQALKVTGPAMPKSMVTTPSAPAGDAEKLPAKFTNRLGMEFVLVGQGTAWLGGGNGQQGEKKVEMPDDFYLGRYEVTQAEWEQVTGLTPSWFSRTGAGKDVVKDIPDADLKRFPVEQVSWDDAQLFLERLNKQEPSAGWIYRLPKADEWEYACRGGPLSDKLDSAFDFYFDKPSNQLLPDQANFTPEPGKGLQRTCKVGSYQPNRLGLHDMHGNVFEWCDDEEKAADGALHRVLRGGDWHNASGGSRAMGRLLLLSLHRNYDLGLRVARVPVGPAKPKPVATTPSAPAEAPIDYAAERKAAEWALSVGAQVQLVDEQGNRCDPVDGKLPEKPFAIWHITIWDGAGVRDDDLARLKPCRRLNGLVLVTTPITGAGLAHLAPINTLRLLDIGDSPALTDSALASIKQLPQLRELRMGNNSSLTDESLSHIGQLPNLETLILLRLDVGDKGIKHLSKLGRLNHVELGRRVTDAGIRQLCADHPQLRGYGSCGTQLTAEGLRILQSLPALERIRLISPMTTEEVLRVSELSQLRDVELFFLDGDENPGDPAFAALARLPRLERITVHGHEPSPSDSVLESWAGVPNLKSIILLHAEDKRRYTAAGIAKFRERRPDVQLTIDGKDYPATAAEAPIDYAAERKAAERLLVLLKDKPGSVLLTDGKGNFWPLKAPLSKEPFLIVDFNVAGHDLSDADVAILAGCRGIHTLSLYGNPKLTLAGLRTLNPLPRLENLYINGTQISRDGLEFLVDYPKLQLLHFDVRQETLDTLPSLLGLQTLGLHKDAGSVGDEGVALIVQKCPGLLSFMLDDPTVRSLAPLSKLTKLQRFGGLGSYFTDETINVLTELPDLDWLHVKELDRAVLERLRKFDEKLKTLSVDSPPEQQTEFKEPQAILPITQFSNVEGLVIAQWIAIDNTTLAALAKMSRLKKLVVDSGAIPDDKRATYRNYTAADIDAFRKARPDVTLEIDGKEYPATK